MSAPAWISFHIYYNSDPFWLLTEGIRPCVTRARDQGLLGSYFFLRYWENGPHVRLRVKPASADKDALLRDRVQAEMESYISRRPSLIRPPARYMSEYWQAQFIAEYGQEALVAKYGPEGRIPYFENNSVATIRYEPETARYGGELGIAVAERYFEASSDIAMDVLAGPNGNDFNIALAFAVRAFFYFCLIFFDAEERLAFCDAYQGRWRDRDNPNAAAFQRTLSFKFERQRERLRRIYRSCEAVLARSDAASEDCDQRWVRLLIDLREDLAAVGSALSTSDAPAGPLGKFGILLPLYIHMNSNRLGLAIPDEVYVAYLVKRTLIDHA
jgi:thiopeptide-type bacteriocin biosynthesis protein